MASTHIDADSTKSAMTLIAAVLVFASTAWAIVNSKLEKARNAAARERVISGTFVCAVVILQSFGCIVFVAIGSWAIFISLYGASVFIHSIYFLRRPEPLPRFAVLNLVVSWSGLVLF